THADVAETEPLHDGCAAIAGVIRELSAAVGARDLPDVQADVFVDVGNADCLIHARIAENAVHQERSREDTRVTGRDQLRGGIAETFRAQSRSAQVAKYVPALNGCGHAAVLAPEGPFLREVVIDLGVVLVAVQAQNAADAVVSADIPRIGRRCVIARGAA